MQGQIQEIFFLGGGIRVIGCDISAVTQPKGEGAGGGCALSCAEREAKII